MRDRFVRFWNALRLKYTAISRSAGFLIDVNDALYKRIGNHSKIIHWRDGQPVYSSFFLGGYSKAKAHHQAVRIVSSMQHRVIPYMVDLAVTDECNCDCSHCSFKSMEDDRKVMSTEQIKNVISQCQELGVVMINFVGGEPLFRPNILEIISSVDKDRAGTLMFTNGWFLEKYARKLKKAGLDSVNVSLDSHIPEKHDEIRRAEGAFTRAVSGMIAAKKAGLTVGISCTVSRESLADGTFRNIIELGKKLKVHEIIVFDVIPTGNMADRKDLSGDIAWTNEIVRIADFYNRRSDCPGIFTYAYNRSHSSMGCSGATNYFYVTPYGDICPCDFNPLILGNILEKPLYRLWDEITRSPEFCKTCWEGCRIQDATYRKKHRMDFKKGAKCISLQ